MCLPAVMGLIRRMSGVLLRELWLKKMLRLMRLWLLLLKHLKKRRRKSSLLLRLRLPLNMLLREFVSCLAIQKLSNFASLTPVANGLSLVE